MNKIVIELHPEDRARLDLLADRLARVADLLEPVRIDVAPLQEAEVSVGLPVEGAAHLEPVDAPATAPAAEPAPVEPVPAPEPVSLPEFQKAVTLRCAESADMKKKVVALVHQFGPCVSEIPAEKRADFLAALAAL